MRRLYGIFFLFCQVSLSAQTNDQDWYISNAMGMLIAPMDRLQSLEEWSLHRVLSDREEILTLFQKGVEVSVTIRTLDGSGNILRVVEFKSGSKVQEMTFRAPQGWILTEKEYRNGQLLFEYRYNWSNSQLKSRTVLDADGTELFTDRFFRSTDGRLRRLERDGPSGPLAEAAWTYGKNGQVDFEWSRDGNTSRYYAYSSDSIYEALYKDDQLLNSRVEKLSLEGQKVELRQESQNNIRTQVKKDSKGRVIEERTGTDDQLTSLRTWQYDDNGRVISQTMQSKAQRSQVSYRYDETGLAAVENTRNGQLVSREHWSEGKKKRTEIFVGGDLVLEEFWDDGEKVKEVFYQDGRVLRERILRASKEENP